MSWGMSMELDKGVASRLIAPLARRFSRPHEGCPAGWEGEAARDLHARTPAATRTVYRGMSRRRCHKRHVTKLMSQCRD